MRREVRRPARPHREDAARRAAVVLAAGARRRRRTASTTRCCATTSRWSATASSGSPRDGHRGGRRRRAPGRRHRLRHRLQGQRLPLADGGPRPRRASGSRSCGRRTGRAPTSARCCRASRTSSWSTGPNTNPFGGLSVVDIEELVTRFALECIGADRAGRALGRRHADAYWRYNDELDAGRGDQDRTRTRGSRTTTTTSSADRRRTPRSTCGRMWSVAAQPDGAGPRRVAVRG